MNKTVGDQGERFVAALLRARGYVVREIGGNYPVIDLEVSGTTRFRVSVKTSATKRHVRMGREASVRQLRDDDFVFALMPPIGSAALDLSFGNYEILIIPGSSARPDALWVHETYLGEPARSGASRSGSAGIMVKSYSKRPQQQEVWARWIERSADWSALPRP